MDTTWPIETWATVAWLGALVAMGLAEGVTTLARYDPRTRVLQNLLL